MGGVRVRYNHLPAIIRALPEENRNAMYETKDAMSSGLDSVLWKDTGKVVSTVRNIFVAATGFTLGVGYYAGDGFYAAFHEWGTVKMAADPRVGPYAHAFEPELASIMSKAVQKAVRAT